MSPEDQAEFDRQLKGVQGLARHFKATLCGLEWKDGHLRGIYAAKPKKGAPPVEEPLAEKAVEITSVRPKRSRPEQFNLL